MLTDQEIIANQVKRISEKTKTNLSARKIHVLWYLCQGENIAPFGSVDTGRTQEQMIEHLAGLEDAIDFLSKKENEERGLMRQYRDLKEKHPDAILLFRCGDFYEAYNEDAKTCATILGIILSWRDNKGAHDYKTFEGAMAGFPHHALDTYLPKLIRAGKRVAICDQLEDPKLRKTVKRGITELVTPGTPNK